MSCLVLFAPVTLKSWIVGPHLIALTGTITTRDGKNHTPPGQQDDDDLCCKCCGTIALNFSGAPQSFPVPVPVEWRKGPVFVVLDRVLPKSPRHIIESPRGPPLA